MKRLSSETLSMTGLAGSWPLLGAIRPQQWVKNLLVIVPALAAHRFDPESMALALVAALAFSLCASAGYLLNDVADREADGLHPRKSQRPIASGALSPRDGIIAAIFLFASALLLAVMWLPLGFSIALICYLLMSAAYTLLLRQMPVVDLVALALFYVMRLVAGALAVAVPLSGWLVIFAIFLFLSLALLKRYGELRLALQMNKPAIIGRSAYLISYQQPMLMIGLLLSVLALSVFAAYILSDTTAAAYSTPLWLFGGWLALWVWLGLAWFKTHHDSMPDDPIVFAISDFRSLALVVLAMLCVVLAL